MLEQPPRVIIDGKGIPNLKIRDRITSHVIDVVIDDDAMDEALRGRTATHLYIKDEFIFIRSERKKRQDDELQQLWTPRFPTRLVP